MKSKKDKDVEIEELKEISLDEALGKMFGNQDETLEILKELGIDENIIEIGGFGLKKK